VAQGDTQRKMHLAHSGENGVQDKHETDLHHLLHHYYLLNNQAGRSLISKPVTK
jgi:hypothetical protein